jgi:hypothetical protein
MWRLVCHICCKCLLLNQSQGMSCCYRSSSIELHSLQDRNSSNGLSKSIDWEQMTRDLSKIQLKLVAFCSRLKVLHRLMYISYQNLLGTKLSISCKIIFCAGSDFWLSKSDHSWLCVWQQMFQPTLTAVIKDQGAVVNVNWFVFDCDNDGFSCSQTAAKWNLSLSQSNEYHHAASQLERGKQIVMSILLRGTNYLAIEMKFCVSLSFIFKSFWRLAIAQASPQSSPRWNWFGWQRASSCNGKRPKVINPVGCHVDVITSFDCDNDGCSCRKIMVKWNLPLSQSNEYHHPDSNGKERSKLWRQLCCREANYLAIEMKFCVSLSFLVTLHLVLMEGQTKMLPHCHGNTFCGTPAFYHCHKTGCCHDNVSAMSPLAPTVPKI